MEGERIREAKKAQRRVCLARGRRRLADGADCVEGEVREGTRVGGAGMKARVIASLWWGGDSSWRKALDGEGWCAVRTGTA